jgi:hypothetical protein
MRINVSENAGFRLENYHNDRVLQAGQVKGLVNLYAGISCAPCEGIVEVNGRKGVGAFTVVPDIADEQMRQEMTHTYSGSCIREAISHKEKMGRYVVDIEAQQLDVRTQNSITFTDIDSGMIDHRFVLYSRGASMSFLRIISVHDNIFIYGENGVYFYATDFR